MQVIPFHRDGSRSAARGSRNPGPRLNALSGPARRSACNAGAMLLLAATFAAGTTASFAAEQVEREDTVKPAQPAAPAAPAAKAAPGAPDAASRAQAERDRDARLEEAKRRLEQAASEVAAISSEMASQAMQGMSTAFGGPRRSIIGAQVEAGAKVRDVSPGGPAELAGIRAGDVILSVNGRDVKGNAREVIRLLREVEPETTVPVRVMRDGKPKEFKVTARPFDRHAFAYQTLPDFDFSFDFDPPDTARFGPGGLPTFGRGLRGMEVTTLTPQLARYFGVDKGLLVVRAPTDDTYKLQDGDVILSIDGRTPTNGSHVARILRSYQAGEKVTLHIMRDRKPLDLQVTLPEDTRTRRARASPPEESEPL